MSSKTLYAFQYLPIPSNTFQYLPYLHAFLALCCALIWSNYYVLCLRRILLSKMLEEVVTRRAAERTWRSSAQFWRLLFFSSTFKFRIARVLHKCRSLCTRISEWPGGALTAELSLSYLSGYPSRGTMDRIPVSDTRRFSSISARTPRATDIRSSPPTEGARVERRLCVRHCAK